MKYLILTLALSFTSLHADDMNKVIQGKNCFNLAKVDYLFEVARDSGIDKKDMMLRVVDDKNLNNETKLIMLNELELIYNLPKFSKYSKSIYNQCSEIGHIKLIDI